MGCLCHNSVHSTVTSACLDRIGVISNECEILIRLGSAEKTVDNILRLVLIALQNLVEVSKNRDSHFICCFSC